MESIDKLNIMLLDDNPSTKIRENEDYLFNLIPEMHRCKGFNQMNPWHPYDVYEHTLRVVDGVEADPILRMTALFHDIGKPDTFTKDKQGVGHFYNHWAASKIIFDDFCDKHYIVRNDDIKTISRLIFYHDIDIAKMADDELDSLIRLFGRDNIIRLFKIKRSDLLAQAKEFHYLLEEYDKQENMILKKISN